MSNYKFNIGDAVQISKNTNSKNAGKFGTVKSRASGGGWGRPYGRFYTISLAGGGTSEIVEKNLRKATQTEVAGNVTGTKKDHMVVSTDYKFISQPMNFNEAVDLAKKSQLATPDSPNYMVVKILTQTTTPKMIVEMKDC